MRTMVIDPRSQHGSGHVYASDGISRRLHHIHKHWAPAYACHRLFLIDLVPTSALAAHDATLVGRAILELIKLMN